MLNDPSFPVLFAFDYTDAAGRTPEGPFLNAYRLLFLIASATFAGSKHPQYTGVVCVLPPLGVSPWSLLFK